MGFFDQINTADNSNEAVTNEKHLPIVTIENIGENKQKVKVDVGGGKHPNDIDHWIQWVEVQVDDMFIARAEFSAAITDPIAEFIVNAKSGGKISAIARCNKHGLWKSTVTC